MTEEIIHVHWEGPIPFKEVARFDERRTDYGIYQVYGPHVTYGPCSLLYIGRAQQRTFATRLVRECEEGWPTWQVANGSVAVHLGRLSGPGTPEDTTWDEQIARVERLLIFAHRPAHNASGLYTNNDPDAGGLHVLNWGDRGGLLPEVSGARWSARFAVIEGYGPYGSH